MEILKQQVIYFFNFCRFTLHAARLKYIFLLDYYSNEDMISNEDTIIVTVLFFLDQESLLFADSEFLQIQCSCTLLVQTLFFHACNDNLKGHHQPKIIARLC